MGFLDRLFGGGKRPADAPASAALASSPREAVRLRPFVPIPRDRPWRSWLGGTPRLPDPFAWPHGDGKPYRFVAQIDCAELPAKLWLGAGPRRGWLAFFVGTENGHVAGRVLHAPTLGPERDSPAAWTREDVRLDTLDAPAWWDRRPPGWPVEVLVHREGEPDVYRRYGRRHANPAEPDPYADETVDLARPEHQPHDWRTLQTLLHVLHRAAAQRREALDAAVAREVDAHEAPAPDREALAAVRAEALALAGRLAARDASRAWDPDDWAPYAEASGRWRDAQLQRTLEAGVPFAIVAGQLAHYATALAGAKRMRADADATARRAALQDECFAHWRALKADERLPPELVGEGTGQRRHEAGYRALRREQPALWNEQAAGLRARFRALVDVEGALRLSEKPDPFQTVAAAYSHAWPASAEAAAATVGEWVTVAERDLAAAERPRVDRTERVASARATFEGVRAVEATIGALEAAAADAEGRGDAFAWDDWRGRVEAVLAADAHRPFDARQALQRWNRLRSDLAARAYASAPEASGLPAPVLAYFLARWAVDARYEIACMGGEAHGYTELVEPEDDSRQLLLELPDSRLFGWVWGDADDLVYAIALDALRRGDFSRVAAGPTGG